VDAVAGRQVSAEGARIEERETLIRLLIVGNSGSGKSTLADRLAERHQLSHLDLDSLAWDPPGSATRRLFAESLGDLTAFIADHASWVIEGCYARLIETALSNCTRLIFLNPGVEACIANARLRPWERHKYLSRELQDANLEMLIGWISGYPARDDELSLGAHRALFDGFAGDKIELVSREAIASL
jgi:adenylate kinase family enzyme